MFEQKKLPCQCFQSSIVCSCANGDSCQRACEVDLYNWDTDGVLHDCLILEILNQDIETFEEQKKQFLESIEWLNPDGAFGPVLKLMEKFDTEITTNCRVGMAANSREKGYLYHQSPHIDLTIRLLNEVIDMYVVYFGITPNDQRIRMLRIVGAQFLEAHDYEVNHVENKMDYLSTDSEYISAHVGWSNHRQKIMSDEEKSARFLWSLYESLINLLISTNALEITEEQRKILKKKCIQAIVATGYAEVDGQLEQFGFFKDAEEKEEVMSDIFVRLIAFADLGYFFGTIENILEFFVRLILEKDFLEGIVTFYTKPDSDEKGVKIIDGEGLIGFFKYENSIMGKTEAPDFFPEPMRKLLNISLERNYQLRKKIFEHIVDHLYIDISEKHQSGDKRTRKVEFKVDDDGIMIPIESEEGWEEIDRSDVQCDSKYWDVLTEYAIKLDTLNGEKKLNGEIPPLVFPDNLKTGPLDESTAEA